MLLNRRDIARLIPHGWSMCLLDEVVRWDASAIRCTSRSHRDPANPLRAGARLPAVCGIEYAAQAMAVHGSLAGRRAATPRTGYLASVREVSVAHPHLDDIEGDLIVDAEKLMGDENRLIYRFTVRVGTLEVLNGRAAVVLDAQGSAG